MQLVSNSADKIAPNSIGFEIKKITFSLKERMIQICRIVFSLGYQRCKQNKLFKAAIYKGDFVAAEKAVKKGANSYLLEEDITKLLKDNQLKSVEFLFAQANFEKTLTRCENEILTTFTKVNDKRLLEIFLKFSPLKQYEDGTQRKMDEATIAKCKMLEKILMDNPADVQIFLDRGLDISSLKSPKLHPLQISPFREKEFAVRVELGLKAGLNPNTTLAYHHNHKGTLLGRALFCKLEDTALKLLAAGADPNALCYVEWYDFYQGHQSVEKTPLEFAVSFATPATIKQLLDLGAKPTRTALLACFEQRRNNERNSEILKILIACPQLQYVDQDILELAINDQHHWLIEHLLEKGVKLSYRMLTYVTQSSYLETAKLLVTKFPTIADETFLKDAIKKENMKLIAWLVELNPALKQTSVFKQFLQECEKASQELTQLITTLK